MQISAIIQQDPAESIKNKKLNPLQLAKQTFEDTPFW